MISYADNSSSLDCIPKFSLNDPRSARILVRTNKTIERRECRTEAATAHEFSFDTGRTLIAYSPIAYEHMSPIFSPKFPKTWSSADVLCQGTHIGGMVDSVFDTRSLLHEKVIMRGR